MQKRRPWHPLTASGSIVEDALYDTPLVVEPESPVRREIALALFADGFESGDTTRWSLTVN
jgi:hypothetical protein